MSMSDPIADMLTRIRNGQMASKATVFVPGSKFKENVLEVLKRQGYIRGYGRDGERGLTVELKYDKDGPVIREIIRVSKPGRRVYANLRTMPRIYNGLGIAILSTPKGVVSDHEARELRVGGEIVCQVF